MEQEETNQEQDQTISTEAIYPVLPLRDVVVYPHMVIPLFVGRGRSVNAIEQAMQHEQEIVLVAQKSSTDSEPNIEDLYSVGTFASIMQMMRLPDGTLKILVEGKSRVNVEHYVEAESYLGANVSCFEEIQVDTEKEQALGRALYTAFDEYAKLNKKVPPEAVSSINNIHDLARLIDTIMANISLKIEERQEILEIVHPEKRAERLTELLQNEIEVLSVEKSIRTRVKQQMDKNQREYYLNEQMKAIQKELGETDEGYNEVEELERKIEQSSMPEEAENQARSELKKLKLMPSSSAEATVVRNYIDTLLEVPWKKRTRVRKNIKRAQEILDEDHYGLEKIKERILEYLAVQQRKRKLKGPILCLIGPPGVGKTSLGRSIARATSRKYVRMSLGGIRDEAEIRGHRRTYIGAMPGQIIQKMCKAGVRNPLFLLDEVDKMSTDFHGDPSSAMLEVLDPEQNHTFNDHYLEVDYDLSDVMFVATANSMNIPPALMDRMEVIKIAGYTEDEKLNIAKRYLIPKSKSESGLKQHECEIQDDAIIEIIRTHTREAGVRSLERHITKICRKVVKEMLINDDISARTITPDNLEDYLGVKKYRYGTAEKQGSIGQATGLAWTEVGGDLLKIEAAVIPGKGKIIRTGQLGDVMKESVQAAVTVIRKLHDVYSIPQDFNEKYDMHIHVPEGATPKDGPSAGVGMCTAMVSVLAQIPIRYDVAMTGEITLRGEVLPIGGLKEKLLAARRGGISTVLIPEENTRELKEIADNVKEGLEIIPVRWIKEVLRIALENQEENESQSEPALQDVN